MVSAPNQPAVAACAPVSSPSAQQPRARPQHRPPPEAATTPAQSPASDTPAATAAAPAVPRSATPPFQVSRAPREPAPNTPPHDASPPAAASQTDTATQSAPHPARRNHARPDPRSAAAAHPETAVTTLEIPANLTQPPKQQHRQRRRQKPLPTPITHSRPHRAKHVGQHRKRGRGGGMFHPPVNTTPGGWTQENSTGAANSSQPAGLFAFTSPLQVLCRQLRAAPRRRGNPSDRRVKCHWQVALIHKMSLADFVPVVPSGSIRICGIKFDPDQILGFAQTKMLVSACK